MNDLQAIESMFDPSDALVRGAETLVDCMLTPEQHADLSCILKSDPLARSWFVDYMQLHASLTWDADDLDLDDMMSGSSFEQVIPTGTFPAALFHGVIGYISSSDWPMAYLIATVVLGIGLLVSAITKVSSSVQTANQLPPKADQRLTLLPTRQSVGRVTGMDDCQFADQSTMTFSGAYVTIGRKYALSRGLMEITYDTGAKVILQGPMTYEVEAKNGGFLSIGRLTGKVEVETAKGFAVRTPTATVTDLGTEFGVAVDERGNTISHVFSGAIKLESAAAEGKGRGAVRILRENEAAQVVKSGDGRGGVRYEITPDKSATSAGFVRKITKTTIVSLDLADVVAGGDGFSGRRNRGLDPTSGRPASALPDVSVDFNLSGDGLYHRVEDVPLIDGVFIPRGGREPMQIDSAGHVFGGFPATDGRTYGYIWSGCVLPREYAANVELFLNSANRESPHRSAIDMAANKGITFDLDAVRRENAGRELLRFRAVVANAEIASEAWREQVGADAWVFVDGKARFERRGINRVSGAIPICIPLNPADRFLTLAATDGGNGRKWDWIVFGNPSLDLRGAEYSTNSRRRSSDLNETEAASLPKDAGKTRAGAQATSYNLNADMAAAETSNVPSPVFRTWSLGYCAADADFHGFAKHYVHPMVLAYRGWRRENGSPGIYVNTGPQWTPSPVDGQQKRKAKAIASTGVCANALRNHAAVMRWTAPAAGTIDISATLSAVDQLVNAKFQLLKNGDSLFDGQIDTSRDIFDAKISKFGVPVSENDTIDLIYGPNSDSQAAAGLSEVFYSVTYAKRGFVHGN